MKQTDSWWTRIGLYVCQRPETETQTGEKNDGDYKKNPQERESARDFKK